MHYYIKGSSYIKVRFDKYGTKSTILITGKCLNHKANYQADSNGNISYENFEPTKDCHSNIDENIIFNFIKGSKHF